MQWVNAATGQPGPQNPEGGGQIPFDQTQTAPEGSASLALGTFEPGGYVIRVIVDGTLVKNFPFVVK
jgi:hypothetical protein